MSWADVSWYIYVVELRVMVYICGGTMCHDMRMIRMVNDKNSESEKVKIGQEGGKFRYVVD